MDRKRVQMLRDMIAGIPEHRIFLDETYKKNGEPCDTIACIWGWAKIYPPFERDGIPQMDNWITGTSWFGVPPWTFGPKDDKREHGSHKQIALSRLDKLLT